MGTNTYIPPLIVDRAFGVYHFEAGGFVAIVTGGKVPTKDAIEMARKFLDLKEEELARAQEDNRIELGGSE